MDEKIRQIHDGILEDLQKVNEKRDLEEVRIKYLSRKGSLSALFDEFKKLPKEEKPKYGKNLNILKNFVNTQYENKKEELENQSAAVENDLDLSLPGRAGYLGRTHILTQTAKEIRDIFKGLGFSVFEGPELESDYYNFEQLNFPEDHPARDMQDTFFINDNFLMRTHTSPVQIRLMEKVSPPLRAIMPGRVFRNEAISAKSYCLFHQVEGLCVDTNITFAELKATLVYFAKSLFGDDVKYRFRPSFFPFTEPSAEVDIWWQPPGKEGRWLEILGCGMVDPNVLKNVNIDAEKYSGYAFGMGIERMAMLKYEIDDIRVFYDNDNRFLKQF
jgi:phenylalanyl-tRNA synthetase alpha chain